MFSMTHQINDLLNHGIDNPYFHVNEYKITVLMFSVLFSRHSNPIGFKEDQSDNKRRQTATDQIITSLQLIFQDVATMHTHPVCYVADF